MASDNQNYFATEELDPADSYPLPKPPLQQAINKSLDKAKKQVSNDLFWTCVDFIPLFGLGILLLDILWISCAITGTKLATWQKMTILALNLLVILIVMVLIAILLYYICSGFSGFGIKLAATLNDNYSFCSAF